MVPRYTYIYVPRYLPKYKSAQLLLPSTLLLQDPSLSYSLEQH